MNKIILKCAADKSLEFELTENDNFGSTQIWRCRTETDKYGITLWFHEIKAEWQIWTLNKVGYLDKNLTKSLNPQSLHFIEEKECSECEGTGKHNPDWYNKALNYMPHHPITHQDCKGTGKIGAETSFMVFDKSESEYDAEIRKELANEIWEICDSDKERDSTSRIAVIHEIEATVFLELNSEQETDGS